ncbi:MAG: LytTR family DNA-binding domain-containing protein [Lachnospiraceae bacterium]|nr:LytTR family DNA-binding domain-containing protein [Lachnospiraceae bacterium]
MLRIAICDDDPTFSGRFETLILKESQKLGLRVETDVFSDGKTLLCSIQNNSHYEIIFIDIEMKQVDGITAAKRIREIDRTTLLIYVSSYDAYLKELFEVEPFRFLSKPLNYEQFSRYFRDACERITETEVFFQFKYNKNIQKVVVKDIVYFESSNRVIYIHLKDGTVQRFYGKLNDIENELSTCRHYFLRIHQSFLVNYDYIIQMDFYNVTIFHNGYNIELKISEDRQKKVRSMLCKIAGGKVVVEK